MKQKLLAGLVAGVFAAGCGSALAAGSYDRETKGESARAKDREAAVEMSLPGLLVTTLNDILLPEPQLPDRVLVNGWTLQDLLDDKDLPAWLMAQHAHLRSKAVQSSRSAKAASVLAKRIESCSSKECFLRVAETLIFGHAIKLLHQPMVPRFMYTRPDGRPMRIASREFYDAYMPRLWELGSDVCTFEVALRDTPAMQPDLTFADRRAKMIEFLIDADVHAAMSPNAARTAQEMGTIRPITLQPESGRHVIEVGGLVFDHSANGLAISKGGATWCSLQHTGGLPVKYTEKSTGSSRNTTSTTTEKIEVRAGRKN